MTDVATIETPSAPAAHGPAPIDPMVSLIERVVMDPDASIDKLERMLEMRERMQAQQAKAAYDNAIAEAKAEIPPIIKTGSVSYGEGTKKTEFTHETLDGIAKVVDPILSKHGLSYRFRSDQDGGNVIVTCIVAHRDGYAEETTLRGAPDASGSKNPYQAVGSAVTYLQRYTLKLALGLAAAKDDDAAAVMQKDAISEDQYRALRDLIEKSGADETALLAYLKVSDLMSLPAGKYGVADKMLRQKMAKNGGVA
jgi:hypothetical protein